MNRAETLSILFSRIRHEKFCQFQEYQKSYDGDKLVVRNLNLDVAEGEFLTLLGPSGSGKTTSLMMLAGFETPTDGEILLRDKPCTRCRPISVISAWCFRIMRCFPI